MSRCTCMTPSSMLKMKTIFLIDESFMDSIKQCGLNSVISVIHADAALFYSS